MLLLVEQNTLATLKIAHRGYVIQTGRIVFSDTATGLKENDVVKKTYLGIS